MPHHVFVREVNKFDPFDSSQNPLNFDQTRDFVFREVNLGDVPCDHGLGTKAQSGQKHLHLFRACILSLIEDDEGIVQGSAPHKCQWSHFDHTLLHKLRSSIKIHHVMKGVVERAKVRIDLLVDIPWEKPQLLASFHSRPGQDDSFNFLFHKKSHCHGHGEIGLSRPSRSNANDQIVFPDGIDVSFLSKALWSDHSLSG